MYILAINEYKQIMHSSSVIFFTLTELEKHTQLLNNNNIHSPMVYTIKYESFNLNYISSIKMSQTAQYSSSSMPKITATKNGTTLHSILKVALKCMT